MGEPLSRFIMGIAALLITLLLTGACIWYFSGTKDTYDSVGEQIETLDPTLKGIPGVYAP